MKDPLEDASADVDRQNAAFILIAIVSGLALLAIFKPGSRDALAIIFGIVLMVMLHEAGHFIAARRAGMKTTEFFLGFGPRLWSFRRGETEYGVKALPLGGYVRIIGMSNLDEPLYDSDKREWRHGYSPDDEPRTYRRGSYKNRLVVVLAGVTVNVLIAVVLFWTYFAAQGVIDLTPRVSEIVKGSPAAEAGFKKGDKFVAVDGTSIKSWDDLKQAIESRPKSSAVFTVLRDGETIRIEATPRRKSDGTGFLGIGPTVRHRDVSVFGAVPESFKAIGDVTAATASGIAHVFSPAGLSEYSKNFSDAPKKGSQADLERPRSLVGIIDRGSDVVHGDVWALLWLLGSISLILALFNTLPLLPFDGGHAAVVVYEFVASKVTRRKVRVDYRKLMPMTALVLALFLMLGLSAMFLDIRDAVGS